MDYKIVVGHNLVPRAPLEQNIEERKKFQDGKKLVRAFSISPGPSGRQLLQHYESFTKT